MMTADSKEGGVTGFGEALRALRERMGLTQFDLSRISGISQSTVSALETGKQRPWPSTRRALASAFSMTLDEFDTQTMPSRRADSTDADADGPWQQAGETIVRLLDTLGETEDRLRRSEQQLSLLRRMLDHVPLILWSTDRDGRITSVTGWAEQRLTTWSRMVGGSLESFFREQCGITDPEFAPLAAQRRALEGETVAFRFPLEKRTLDGVIEPQRDARGQITGTIAVAVPRPDSR